MRKAETQSTPREGRRMMSKCEAVQHSDQMVCDACALAWDMNDPAPPECENARLNTELKLSKKDAAITSYYAEGRRGDRKQQRGSVMDRDEMTRYNERPDFCLLAL